jgi:hypothetical protein
MKNIFKKSAYFMVGSMLLFSCSEFEELNVDPKAANIDQVQVEYFINNSIIGAQQDPNIAERAFVLYWKTAGRQHRNNGISVGTYNDGWSSEYYTYMSGWLNSANMAIETANSQISSGSAKAYTKNTLQVARIWRAYLMSELTDNFGPIPVNAFNGENPSFNDEKAVYYHLLQELKEASAALDLSVNVDTDIKKLDPAYEYDFNKWKKYSNSLRLRLAMRLSEVDPAKAKQEFEEAASGNVLITSMDETFQVQEIPGWDALTGVMSREWNSQNLPATLNNLYIGLGGVSSAAQLDGKFQAHIKPENYMGLKLVDHMSTLTNDPSAGFFLDGLPAKIDPRAYKTFSIPGDFSNTNFSTYPSWTTDAKTTKRNLLNADGSTLMTLDAEYTWNAPALGAWGAKGTKNQVYTFEGTNPRLSQAFRGSNAKRIFFAPWETYFLLAEGAVRGWNSPVPAKEAYEAGVKSSFNYWNVDGFAAQYLSSESYNRAGTSVSFTHTTEPASAFTATFVDGYSKTPGTASINYPKNTLYKGGSVKNDQLTKIITQKFIAQCPWLPMETWSDQRRLGLPFFENPAVEIPLVDMPALTPSTYMESSIKFFPQPLATIKPLTYWVEQMLY